MNPPLLDIAQLHAGYVETGTLLRRRPMEVLHGVSLRLQRGRTLAVVGESGSGKSTLGKVIAGLLPATSGSLQLDGIALSTRARGWPAAQRRRIQLVFQDPLAALDARMRVGALLEEPLRIHRLGDARTRGDRVQALLSDVGLPAGTAARFPHQLSGGQRQRVGIARALALQPDILVLDEPVSALDVSVQAHVLNLLGDLQRRHGLSYLFISHDMAVVRHIADEVAVMHAGTLVEQGPAAQVLDAPRHPYTRSLLAAVPGQACGPTEGIDPARCRPPVLRPAAAARLALHLARQDSG